MRSSIVAAGVAIVIPLCYLISIGCAAPSDYDRESAAPNYGAGRGGLLIGITTDIVDEAGQSLVGIKARVDRRLSSSRTAFFDDPPPFDKTFHYAANADALVVTFAKSGYASEKRVYALSDTPELSPEVFTQVGNAYVPAPVINTMHDPHSKVVMKKVAPPPSE
jgi:hypothetical protein